MSNSEECMYISAMLSRLEDDPEQPLDESDARVLYSSILNCFNLLGTSPYQSPDKDTNVVVKLGSMNEIVFETTMQTARLFQEPTGLRMVIETSSQESISVIELFNDTQTILFNNNLLRFLGQARG